MANDATADIKPLKYHSCDTPRGMCYYIVDDLTDFQQTNLNDLKIKIARDNKQYLQAHPEIRACISLLTRHMFRLRPKKNIYECVARFFARSRLDIEDEINDYIASKKPTIEGDSAVELFAKSTSAVNLSSFDITSLMSGYETDSFNNYSQSMQNIDMRHIQEITSGKDLRSFSQAVRIVESSEDTERLRKAALQEMMEDIINTNIIDILKEGSDSGGSSTGISYGGILQQKVSFCPTVTVSRGPRSLIISQPDDDEHDIHLIFDSMDEDYDGSDGQGSLAESQVAEQPEEPHPVMERWITEQERPAAEPSAHENIIHLTHIIRSDKELYTSLRKHIEDNNDNVS